MSDWLDADFIGFIETAAKECEAQGKLYVLGEDLVFIFLTDKQHTFFIENNLIKKEEKSSPAVIVREYYEFPSLKELWKGLKDAARILIKGK
ncbi:TPA: hypothetical protein HA241_07735 [Candidatus Woesearchaeota archaeon]|nr:hypothetical protein [Candidatus Woesearchaeota archaeon]